jgi:hypothetical protein
VTRRLTGTPANPHGSRTGTRRSGARPRTRPLAPLGVVDDALALPAEVRKASGLKATTIRRLRPHYSSGTYADPKTGQIYSARLNPIGGVCADGYVRISGGRSVRREQYAHRVVYEAVHGPIPEGMEIDHRNTRRADNRVANLQAVTAAQNRALTRARGRVACGERIPNAKLTEELVRQIRATSGLITGVEWAHRLGVDRTSINSARRGQTWRHVVPCPRLRTRRRSRTRKNKRP